MADDHAKRKRDEKESADKITGTMVIPIFFIITPGIMDTTPADTETVPPKKIKPEVESNVTKAQVKQIQRNLKTMPLEDGSPSQDPESASKDMDDVESDNGTPESGQETMDHSITKQDQSIEDLESSTSDLGDPVSDVHSATQPDQDETNRPASTDPKSPLSSATSTPKTSSGFSNTSTMSPFGNVASSGNVFGSSRLGPSAPSFANPFLSGGKTANVFDEPYQEPPPTTEYAKGAKSLSSGGFGNTSSISPFATMAGSTNVFGGAPVTSVFDDSPASIFGGSSKSVFGQSSSAGSAGLGSFAKSAQAEETTGSVFGSKSVLGSSSTGTPSSSLAPATASTTAESKSPSPAPTSTFGTFGAKQSFLSKESSFASGSFIEQGASQGQEDFDSLLTQETNNGDGENDDQEENDTTFGTGIFSNADQIDVHTGEEDEVTMFATKGKLFADADKSQTWKERGKGTFKINVGRKDTKSARLVMRTDGALRLILNIAVFPTMNALITGDKYIRFVGIEEGKPVLFLLKVKDAVVATEVLECIARAAERQQRGARA
ncbi:hypothetical protein BG004_003034, partial [Podila humilis]